MDDFVTAYPISHVATPVNPPFSVQQTIHLTTGQRSGCQTQTASRSIITENSSYSLALDAWRVGRWELLGDGVSRQIHDCTRNYSFASNRSVSDVNNGHKTLLIYFSYSNNKHLVP